MRAVLLCFSTFALFANQTGQPSADLASASLEELLQIPITTVSKKAESAWKTASAIYVITQDDIRRSGLTSIPEILRMVPGLHVARLSGGVWSVSARGFSGRYSDKLLVMIDRRTVYSPVYGGVEWGLQNVFLPDIDRIEVVRGPGATMWGANAVSGVVHIITRSARETEDTVFTTATGTENHVLSAVRHGGPIGSNASYRAYASYTSQSPLQYSDGSTAFDSQRYLRGGFRFDWDRSERQLLTVQGDLYRGGVDVQNTLPVLTPPFVATTRNEESRKGGNLLGRWRFRRSGASEFLVQAYLDKTSIGSELGGIRATVGDFDFQHSFHPGGRHDFVWGAGYRATATEVGNSFFVAYTPAKRTDNLWTGFLQDEIALVPDRFSITLGAKLDHNAYTGGEVQPGIRLLWTPTNRQTLWATTSRAITTPSRTRSDIRINVSAFPLADGGTGVATIFGTPEYQSPSIRTHEVGYRVQPSKNLSFDLASFLTRHHRLQTLEPGMPYVESEPSPLHLVYPLWFSNKMSGSTYGAELVGNWTPARAWKLAGSYSYLRVDTHPELSKDTNADKIERWSPRNQFSIRSMIEPRRSIDFDTSAYYVGALPTLSIPAYLRLDCRLAWRTRHGFELSVSGYNLLDARHPEFIQEDGRARLTEIGRTFQTAIVWRFGGK